MNKSGVCSSFDNHDYVRFWLAVSRIQSDLDKERFISHSPRAGCCRCCCSVAALDRSETALERSSYSVILTGRLRLALLLHSSWQQRGSGQQLSRMMMAQTVTVTVTVCGKSDHSHSDSDPAWAGPWLGPGQPLQACCTGGLRSQPEAQRLTEPASSSQYLPLNVGQGWAQGAGRI